MEGSVFLDSSFLIRFLDDENHLHRNAMDYYKYFLDKGIPMKVSTIAIAEYCVRGQYSNLPLKNLQVLPFNITHSKRAGKFANALFTAARAKELVVEQRAVIPNDSKLFSQCDVEPSVQYFVTSDTKSEKLYRRLSDSFSLNFQRIDIHVPYSKAFGVLL